MSAHLYIEGGESKEDQVRCREGFRKLFEKAGLTGRLPRLTASGGRAAAFDDFKTAQRNNRTGAFTGLLVDSEDPVADPEKTWDHLKSRDGWEKPAGAVDEQVFLMTTCMETWIVADRAGLREHYGHKLQENILPPLQDPEKRNRHEVHDSLTRATRDCTNQYSKGKRSFEVLGVLNPEPLTLLPGFARTIRILRKTL